MRTLVVSMAVLGVQWLRLLVLDGVNRIRVALRVVAGVQRFGVTVVVCVLRSLPRTHFKPRAACVGVSVATRRAASVAWIAQTLVRLPVRRVPMRATSATTQSVWAPPLVRL